MDIHISVADGVPIYQQVVTQVKYLVAAGRMRAGEEMPTIRALAEQLHVNPNTIARAYRELEQDGTVEKRSTKGTFIAEKVSRFSSSYRQAALHERVDQLLAESSQLGFSVTQVIAQIRSRAKVMNRIGKLDSGSSRGKQPDNRIRNQEVKKK